MSLASDTMLENRIFKQVAVMLGDMIDGTRSTDVDFDQCPEMNKVVEFIAEKQAQLNDSKEV